MNLSTYLFNHSKLTDKVAAKLSLNLYLDKVTTYWIGTYWIDIVLSRI